MRNYLKSLTISLCAVGAVFLIAGEVVADEESNAISSVTVGGRDLAAGGQINVYDYAPTIAGETDTVSTMTITLNPQGTGNSRVANRTADAEGDFSYDVAPKLGKKSYILSMVSTDEYGNLATFAGIVNVKQRHPNGTIIKTADNATVYLLDGGLRRGIPSPTVFLSRNYQWDDIAIVSSDEMSYYTIGSNMTIRNGALVKPEGEATVYVIQGTQKRPFSSADIFLNLGYSWDSIYTITDAEAALYTTGSVMEDEDEHLPGTPVKLAGDATVYVLETVDDATHKRAVPSAAIFLSHGLQWQDVVTITSSEMSGYPAGDNLFYRDGTLIVGSGDATVYIMESEEKRAFSSGTVFLEMGYAWDNILSVTADEIEAIADGDPIL